MPKDKTNDSAPDASKTEAGADTTKPAHADEVKDPFAAALDNPDNVSVADDDDAAEPQDSGFGFEKGTFNEEAERFLADLCDSHGLDKKTMAPFLQEMAGKSRDMEKKQAEQVELSRREELKKMWGRDYGNRVNQVAGFIRQVGKSVGWSEEQIHSLGTAEGFRLFSDIMRYVGGGGTRGKSAPSAPANQYAGWNKDKLEAERARLSRDIWLANDDEQKQLRERHAQVVSMLKGERVEPFLPLKPRTRKK